MSEKTILESQRKDYYVKEKGIRQENAKNNSKGADQQIIYLSGRKCPFR